MTLLPPIVCRLVGTVARRTCAQAGESLIEVVVAAFLAVVVIGAIAASLASGNASSYAAQRESALVEVADQQLESIRQIVKVDGFSDLAMTALPAAASGATLRYNSATPLDPNSFVTTCSGTPGYKIESNYDNTSSGTVTSVPSEAGCATGVEPLVTSTSVGVAMAMISPGPTSVTVGGMTVKLYQYVTETSVGCNASLGNGSCTDDARRVIVAAVDSQTQASCSSATTTNTCASNDDAPVYVSTIFTNSTPSNAPNSTIGLTLGAQLG